MTNRSDGLLSLPSNTLHLWMGVPTASPTLDDSAMAVLSHDEQQRWQRFVSEPNRDLFAWSHVALRRVLSRYASIDPNEWSIESAENGRPEISNDHDVDGLRFNISHTPGLVVMVVNRTFNAGIDAADVDRSVDIDVVAKTTFSRAERRLLERLPADERRAMFTKIWALKEAFVKGTGAGGNMSLRDLSFDPSNPDRIHFTCKNEIVRDPEAWSFALGQEAGNHMVAIACEPASRMHPPSLARFDLSSVM